MRVLVLGLTGQLAAHLRELLPDAAYWGRKRSSISAEPADDRAAIETIAYRQS